MHSATTAPASKETEAFERARDSASTQTSEDRHSQSPDDSRLSEASEQSSERDTVPPQNHSSGNNWRTPLCWMLPAFLLRLVLVWRFEQVISPDGVQYVTLARNLVAGNFHEGLSTYWPPLYPLLVGVSSIFFRDMEFAGRFVSVLAGSLLVVPCYRLIRNWYGERAAFIGAGLVAVHPLLLYYSTVLLTESTYTLLFACGVVAGWSALSKERPRAFLLAGATFGACTLWLLTSHRLPNASSVGARSTRSRSILMPRRAS